VGATKRGKGTKLIAVADGAGLPLAVHTTNASPHEVRLVRQTVCEWFINERPEKIISDRAYDSDPLDAELAELDIELIAPHKANRKKARTQDGRKLRRYKRRWKIERLFAWLHNFRRIVVRYEYHLKTSVLLLSSGYITFLPSPSFLHFSLFPIFQFFFGNPVMTHISNSEKFTALNHSLNAFATNIQHLRNFLSSVHFSDRII
jgi:transposase